MRPLVKAFTIVVALLAAPPIYLGYQLLFNIWWQSPQRIEAYLRSETPIGSSEQTVVNWLAARGASSAIERTPVGPHSEYPLTTTGGEAFIPSVVNEHTFVTRAVVEAFYTFDSKGTLADVRVRVDWDGP